MLFVGVLCSWFFHQIFHSVYLHWEQSISSFIFDRNEHFQATSKGGIHFTFLVVSAFLWGSFIGVYQPVSQHVVFLYPKLQQFLLNSTSTLVLSFINKSKCYQVGAKFEDTKLLFSAVSHPNIRKSKNEWKCSQN